MKATERSLDAIGRLTKPKRTAHTVRGHRGGDGGERKLYRHCGVVVAVRDGRVEPVRVGGEVVLATGANAGLALLPKRLRREVGEIDR